MNNLDDSTSSPSKKKTYSEIMMERYAQEVLCQLPEVDKDDVDVLGYGISS